MKWSQVEANWAAFLEPIAQRWPEADPDTLEDIDGDRAALIAHLAETGDMSRSEAAEELSDWLESGIPIDVMMDESNDGDQIGASGRFIPSGEDVYSDDAAFGDDNQAERPMGRT